MDYLMSFVIGGAVCAAVQILMEKTKMLSGRIMVLLVCMGAFLSAIGVFDDFQRIAYAGANVPLLGFGNVLYNGVREAVDRDGFIGIFEGGFSAGAVGTSAALIFGYIASLLANPKMKK